MLKLCLIRGVKFLFSALHISMFFHACMYVCLYFSYTLFDALVICCSAFLHYNKLLSDCHMILSYNFLCYLYYETFRFTRESFLRMKPGNIFSNLLMRLIIVIVGVSSTGIWRLPVRLCKLFALHFGIVFHLLNSKLNV